MEHIDYSRHGINEALTDLSSGVDRVQRGQGDSDAGTGRKDQGVLDAVGQEQGQDLAFLGSHVLQGQGKVLGLLKSLLVGKRLISEPIHLEEQVDSLVEGKEISPSLPTKAVLEA